MISYKLLGVTTSIVIVKNVTNILINEIELQTTQKKIRNLEKIENYLT